MSGIHVSAVLLAVAVLAAPPPARRRLSIPAKHRPSGRVVAVPAVPAVLVVALMVPPSLVLVSLVAGTLVAVRVRRRRRDRRRRGEGQQLAAALEVLVGELRIGAHPLRAFTIAACESDDAVGAPMRAVATRAQLGADVAGGLRSMATDSSVPAYWHRLAVFWELAAEHGLAMSVLMRAAHRDIVDRQRFADRTHAALAGARATAAILACLPVLGVLLGQLIGARPVRFLFSGGPGGVLLLIGVTLISAGLIWADRIIDRLVP